MNNIKEKEQSYQIWGGLVGRTVWLTDEEKVYALLFTFTRCVGNRLQFITFYLLDFYNESKLFSGWSGRVYLCKNSAQAGCDTRSFFKWNTASFNFKFSFSLTSCLWRMGSTPSLPLCPNSLWPEVTVRVPPMGWIEIFNHLLHLKPINCGQTNELWLI